ncbi:enoyl-CoA hydratase/isomerase family protein [Phreatobacter stygius]|uniref:Enoyl-CoA hydratase/isomerase family protein n=1 Tax=Phreatobacter stygius TaxID=1940610 RepID=A0A4D7B037_9HYPH|nr:enoyl-CoA hydratase-related protein [Phreatobacter stygius]QCI66979.1 enoyl-CoA hydratase/isomerase family protein [Phreatobacter stygius]
MTDASAYLTYDGPIATLTLNRPESFNAVGAEAAATLAGLARELDTRADLRVVVIRGAGPAFCAGGDINVFAAHLDDPGPMVRGILDSHHDFLQRLQALPAIVVTSVHGAAAGAGLSLAFMGDLCIAADTARFTPAYARLGVSPDGGGTVGLVRAVGARRALQIYLMEDGFDASQAEAWGLVNKVVPADMLEAATKALAERLAGFNPAAVAATKRLVHASAGRPMAEQLEAEMTELIGCMKTAPFRDAVHRFIAKSRAAKPGASA